MKGFALGELIGLHKLFKKKNGVITDYKCNRINENELTNIRNLIEFSDGELFFSADEKQKK